MLTDDPDKMSKLSNLVKLDVVGYPELAELLKAALEKIATLEILAAHGTKIPPKDVRDILDACAILRNGHDFYPISCKASVTEVEVEVEVEVKKVEPLQNSILKEWLVLDKV